MFNEMPAFQARALYVKQFRNLIEKREYSRYLKNGTSARKKLKGPDIEP